MSCNKRGHAERSTDRNTRYATHVPVLQSCVEALAATAEDPIDAVEHGMGLSSTPFFHSLPHVRRIVSLEREPEWLQCADCLAGSTQLHVVTLTLDDGLGVASPCIERPKRTLALVDGFATQRIHVLERWMKAGVAFIVEHDAETYTIADIMARRNVASRYGYVALQYVGHDPETAIFIAKGGPRLSVLTHCVML